MAETPIQSPTGTIPKLDERSWSLLKRTWRDWVRGQWKELVVSSLLTAVIAASSGAYPLIIKFAFNSLGPGKLDLLWVIVVAIVAVTFIRSLFSFLQTVISSRTVYSMTVGMQKAIYAHLLRADFARLARETPGHLVSRLTNDIGAIQTAALALLNTSFRDVLSVAAVVGTMLWLDWQLALIVLCVYPVAAWPIMRIGQKLRRVAKRTQSELGGMTSSLTESLSSVRLIKSFRLEGYAAKRTNQSFDEVFRLRMKAVRSRAAMDPLLEVLGGLAIAGVLALAGYRIASGISTVGDFMGFLTALALAAQPMRAFGNLNAKLQEGLAAVQRVFELLDEKPAIVDVPGAQPLKIGRGEIRFDDVTFAYEDDEPAVRDVTLDVAGGTTVALVGRSGAGKTTVLNLVPRFFEPQRGRILIDGQDIRGVTIASLRDSISIVSQDITLFNDTVRANILLGRLGASETEVIAAAEAAAALDFIGELPNGFDTIIGDRGMRLSGGQRQRIALARAILKDAPILLLDEATSALDTQSERLVQEALARFSKDRTTLVIAHRLSTIQDADMICVMEDGRIVETGPHAALVARDGVYAQLSRLQVLTAAG
ncbi:MAG: ABC transporter ATP-binding protein [Hyphomicrobiaceae bacterium]